MQDEAWSTRTPLVTRPAVEVGSQESFLSSPNRPVYLPFCLFTIGEPEIQVRNTLAHFSLIAPEYPPDRHSARLFHERPIFLGGAGLISYWIVI